jgi:hypothetical protein
MLRLLSMGRIAIEQPNGLFQEIALLASKDAPSTANPLPSHLWAVEEALTTNGPGGRLVSAKVLHALQKRFGYDFQRYI